MPIGSGGLINRADESLAFAIAGRITTGVRKELNRDAGVRPTIERAGDGRARTVSHRGADNRKVLQVIGAGVRVAHDVWRHAVASQVNSETAVCEDRVSQNRVIVSRVIDRIRHEYAMTAVKG